MRLLIIPGDEPDPQHGVHVATILPETIEAWVAEAIEANSRVQRDTLSQEALDHVVRILHAEGETYLAASILALVSFRVDGREAEALSAILQLTVDGEIAVLLDRHCRQARRRALDQ